MQVKSRYFFDHVPKTAGMAIRRVFEEAIGPEDIAPEAPHFLHGLDIQAASRRYAKFKLIAGHVHHRSGEVFAPDRYYFTVLRDPVDRVMSAYYYFRTALQPEENFAVSCAHRYDLEGFVSALAEHGDTEVANWQAVHFATSISRNFGAGNSALLDLAAQALNRYDLVIPYDKIDQGVAILRGVLGCPGSHKMAPVNVTPKRDPVESIPPSARRQIEALNTVDAELYRIFRERFINRKTVSPAEPVAPITASTTSEFGDRAIEVVGIEVAGDQSGQPEVRAGETGTIFVNVRAHETVPDLTVGIEITDETGEVVFGSNSCVMGKPIPVVAGNDYEVRFCAPITLGEGVYFVTVALHRGLSHLERCFHWREKATNFRVSGSIGHPFSGYAKLNPELSWATLAH